MDKMDTYKVDLLRSSFKDGQIAFDIDDDFFAAIDGMINRGNLKTTVDCRCTGSMYKFEIHSVGSIVVPCDRCLADLELRIDTVDELVVKLGEEYSDEGDCVIVPEAEGVIDLAQYIYEFIVLSMPIVCTHEPGKCDDAMMLEFSKHQATRSGYEDDENEEFNPNYDEDEDVDVVDDEVPIDEDNIDPRWAALRALKAQNPD